MLPIWSVAADARVVAVRAFPPAQQGVRVFDASRDALRMVRDWSGEHLLVGRGGTVVRLDVIEGTVLAGPVSLHFELPDDDRLEHRIAAIRALTGTKPIRCRHLQLAGRLRALQAADARAAGAGLREIADSLLGAGDWPGDGEHRKSAVRRLVTTGERLIRQGPLPILADIERVRTLAKS